MAPRTIRERDVDTRVRAAGSGLPRDRAEITPPAREYRLLGYLGLFSSVGTLVCCALPSLLVLLGLGATMASVLASAPWLVALSRYKAWIFAASGLLIAANFYYVYRLAPRLLARSGACATDDPTCARASRMSRALLWVSALLLALGFSVAYLLPAVLGWLYV